MKKIPLFILFLFMVGKVFSQPIVNRAGPANTVQDARWAAQYNMFTPRYFDTTAANLNLGIDSCGALIYTYTGNAIWFRQCSPKAWIQVAAGGVSPTGNFWALGGNTIYSQFIPRVWGIGSLTQDSIGIMTNGQFRLKFYADGIEYSNNSTDSLIGINLSGYAVKIPKSGGSVTTIYTGDGTLNEDRSIDGDQHNFSISNTATASILSTNGNITTAYAGNGNNARIEASNSATGRLSAIFAHSDSVAIWPSLGVVSIDTLAAWAGGDTTSHKPITWNIHTKRMEVSPSWFGGSGSGGSPAGNYGDVQLNRNGAFATPASDSLRFTSGGLSIKGTLTVSSRASGAITDSVLTINTSSGLVNQKAMTVINTASRDSGDVIQWDGRTNVYVPLPSGSANLLGSMVFQTGVTENAPAAGDSTTTNTYFIGKKIFVYREGYRQDSASSDGYTFSNSTGVLTFHPPLASNERVQVDVYDTTSVYYIAVQAPPSPPADLTFTTRYEFTNSGTVMLQGSGAGQNDGTLNHAAIDNLYIAANTTGRIFCKFVTGENNFLLGFNTTNSNQFYTDYEAALYIDGSSVIKKWESGAFSGSYGTASNNIYYGIYRDGATGTIKLQSSTSASDWSGATDLATLSYTTTSAIYLCATVRGEVTSKITNPQAIGAQ